jgi:hypothetical protein
LQGHGRGRRHQHEVDPPSQQKFADHQRCLDGLTQADIVGNQQIHPWKAKGFTQRRQLIGIEADACAERGLEQVAVGCSGSAPFNGAKERREHLSVVSAR